MEISGAQRSAVERAPEASQPTHNASAYSEFSLL
jgi:hypothetical protein